MSRKESLLIFVLAMAFSDSRADAGHSSLDSGSVSMDSCWTTNGNSRCGGSENWPETKQAEERNAVCSCNCICTTIGNCCRDFPVACATYSERCAEHPAATSSITGLAKSKNSVVSGDVFTTSQDFPGAPGNLSAPPPNSSDEQMEGDVCGLDKDKLCSKGNGFFGEKEYFQCKCSANHCCQSGSMCKKNGDQEVTCTHPTAILLLLLIVPFSLMIGCFLVCVVMRYRLRRARTRINMRMDIPFELQLGEQRYGVGVHRRDQDADSMVELARTDSELKNSHILRMVDGSYTIAWPYGESGKSKYGAKTRT